MSTRSGACVLSALVSALDGVSHHRHQTDDLWRAVEISKRVAHAPKLTQLQEGPRIALTEPTGSMADCSDDPPSAS
jgi:hypothetical protein